MSKTSEAVRTAAILGAGHVLPARHWHASGYAVSIVSSLGASVAIGIFFIAGAGFTPAEDWQTFDDFTVTWLLLTYIWLQMGSLLLVGAGTKQQMWLDALTSIVPLFVIMYVLLQHYTGYMEISSFQVKTAWVTAYTALLDLVVDLGVTIMLSRQVVDVGGGGVA